MQELDKFFQERYASYSKRVDEEEEGSGTLSDFFGMKEDILRDGILL